MMHNGARKDNQFQKAKDRNPDKKVEQRRRARDGSAEEDSDDNKDQTPPHYETIGE